MIFSAKKFEPGKIGRQALKSSIGIKAAFGRTDIFRLLNGVPGDAVR